MVALYTCAVLTKPFEDVANRGFCDLTTQIEASLAADPPAGLIRTWPLQPGFPSDANSESASVPTLSAWEDLASAFWFSYRSTLHRQALGRRREWFARTSQPIYVLWHAREVASVSPNDGVLRLRDLRQNGPSAAAFDFLHPFDGDGRPVPVETLRRSAPEDALGPAMPLMFSPSPSPSARPDGRPIEGGPSSHGGLP